MSDLFGGALPVFPVALPDEQLRLLASLPEWPTTTEIFEDQERIARALERQGLIKISREKMDPIAIRPTWFAGRLEAASLRRA